MKDGGKAFPSAGYSEGGMTMREWYAGMALQGLLANPETAMIAPISESHAKWAVEYADAVIARLAEDARNQGAG